MTDLILLAVESLWRPARDGGEGGEEVKEGPAGADCHLYSLFQKLRCTGAEKELLCCGVRWCVRCGVGCAEILMHFWSLGFK